MKTSQQIKPGQQVKEEEKISDRPQLTIVPSENNKLSEEKKENISTTNSYFYKIENHHELFKIGRSFYNDYLNGLKHFSIASANYKNLQQKTVLGLASFFDHENSLNIAIISDTIDKGCYSELYKNSESCSASLDNCKKELPIKKFHHHFDMINLNAILKLSHGFSNSFELEQMLSAITETYDVILWDLPELHTVQENPNLYFPIMERFDSLSIVVSFASSSAREVEEIQRFFNEYGVSLKGLIINSIEKKGDKSAA